MIEEMNQYLRKKLKDQSLTIESMDENDVWREYITIDNILYYINECNGKLSLIPFKYISNNQEVVKEFIIKNHKSKTFLLDFGLERFNRQYRKQIIDYYFKNIYPEYFVLYLDSENQYNNSKYIFQYVPKELLLEIPEEYKDKDFYSEFCEKIEINEEMKKEYRNQEIYNALFALHNNIKEIPKEFINESLFDYYIDDLIKKGKTKSFKMSIIPKEFRNQKIYNFAFYICFNRNIKKIPMKFRTKRMYAAYLEQEIDINLVPKNYLNQRACNKYYLHTLDLENIPNKFVNQELYDYFYKFSTEMPSDKIKMIPPEYRTKKMFYNIDIIENCLELVPDEFITQDLYDYYFKKSSSENFDINIIPKEFWTQEMYNKYYLCHRESLKMIPQQFANEKLWIFMFKNTDDFYFNQLPDEFLTKQMCKIYFLIRKDLSGIPESFINEELFEFYFHETEDLEAIPLEYITDEMKEKVMQKNDEYFNKSSKNFKERIILYEFKKNITKGITKSEIQGKYNLSPLAIDSVIKTFDPSLQEQINGVLNKNINEYIKTCIEEAGIIEEIVLSLGKLDKRLTTEQKIKFLCLIENSGITKSAKQIYTVISNPENGVSKKYSSLIFFCKRFLGFKNVAARKNYKNKLHIDGIDMNIYTSKWLMDFDVEKQFHPKKTQPSKFSYINDNNEIIEIDETTAQNIISRLKENHIPTKNCVVNEAFKRYAFNDLDNFINELNSISITPSEKTKQKKL